MFNQIDINFMQIALEEAKLAKFLGNFPIGAVLTIDDVLIGREKNTIHSETNRINHAELKLFGEYSKILWNRKKDTIATIYTTLEPCLMCLAASRMVRLDKIIYACPDPVGGVTSLDPNILGDWYALKWPKIEQGPFGKKAHSLLLNHFKKKYKEAKDFDQKHIYEEYIKKFKKITL